MAVVKEIRNGLGTITIHDDCYIHRSQKEIDEIVDRASAIIYAGANRKKQEEVHTA